MSDHAKRTLYGALVSAGLVFFTTLGVEALGAEVLTRAGVAGGVAFMSYLATRGVAEGYIDRNGTSPTKGELP